MSEEKREASRVNRRTGKYSLGRQLDALTLLGRFEAIMFAEANRFLASEGKLQLSRAAVPPLHYERATELRVVRQSIEQGEKVLGELFLEQATIQLNVAIMRTLLQYYEEARDDGAHYNTLYLALAKDGETDLVATFALYYQSENNLIDQVCARLVALKDEDNLLHRKKIIDFLGEAKELFRVRFDLMPLQ
jgi:hypothetical protein